MALGQVSARPLGAPTGQRVGGGQRRATTHRTTPLAPRPTTPLNTGNIRRPAGMNAQMGESRSDRTSAGYASPSRTRALRPLIADRVQRQDNPMGFPTGPMQQQPQLAPQSALAPTPQQFQPQVTPGQMLMRQTMRAYQPQQPQPRGPFAPTPATVQNFTPPGFTQVRPPGPEPDRVRD